MSGKSDRHGIWQMRHVAYPKYPGGQILFGVYDLTNEAVSTKGKKGQKRLGDLRPGQFKGLTDRLTRSLFLRARVSHQGQALANRAQNVCRQPAVPRAHSASLSRVKRMLSSGALCSSRIPGHTLPRRGRVYWPRGAAASVAAQSYQISTLVTTPPSARSYLHSCCLSVCQRALPTAKVKRR
jgi:hypothetical protein